MGVGAPQSREARDGGVGGARPGPGGRLPAGLWIAGFVLLQATPFMLANPHSGPALSSCYAFGATGLLAGAWLGPAVRGRVSRAGREAAWGAIPHDGAGEASAGMRPALHAPALAAAAIFALAMLAALAVLEIVGLVIAVQGGPEAPIILLGPYDGWPGVRPLLQGWEDPLLLAIGLIGGASFTGVATRAFGRKGSAEDGGAVVLGQDAGAGAGARSAGGGLARPRLALLGALFASAFALRAAFAAAFAGGLPNWWEQPFGVPWLLVAGGWALVGLALARAARRWHAAAPALLSLVALGALAWNALTRAVAPAVVVAGREGVVVGVALLLCAVALVLALADARREGEGGLRSCRAFLEARAGALGESLAEREEACAALMLAGRTSAETAEVLGVGASTVRSYLQRAYRKLDVADGRELRRLYEEGAAPVAAGDEAMADDRLAQAAAGALALALALPASGRLSWHGADAVYLGVGLVLMTAAVAALAAAKGGAAARTSRLPLVPRVALAVAAAALAFCAQAAWSIPAKDGGAVFWVLAGAAVAFCAGALAGPCQRRFPAMAVALGAIALVACGALGTLPALGLVALAALASGVIGDDCGPSAAWALAAPSPCGSRSFLTLSDALAIGAPALLASGAALFFGTIASHRYTDALIFNEVAVSALGGDGAVAGAFAIFTALLVTVLLASMAVLGLWLRDAPLRAAAEQVPAGRVDSRGAAHRRAHLRSLGLTDLQAGIVLGIAEGETAREIATALHCSIGTVNATRWMAYRRLGVITRDQLTARLVAATKTFSR